MVETGNSYPIYMFDLPTDDKEFEEERASGLGRGGGASTI